MGVLSRTTRRHQISGKNAPEPMRDTFNIFRARSNFQEVAASLDTTLEIL
jgi:hypothetical protein